MSILHSNCNGRNTFLISDTSGNLEIETDSCPEPCQTSKMEPFTKVAS